MPDIPATEAAVPLVLVLDAGSSSLRASVFDARARQVEGWEARDRHPLTVTADGGVQADPADLRARLDALIDRVLALAGARAGEIDAVAMASFAATVLGAAGDGTPLTPLYTYADTRPAADVRRLRAEMDECAVHDRTGCRLHSSYLPARLVWLRRTCSETYARVERWLSLPEYLYHGWFGTFRCSLSVASWSGLLDRRTLTWDGPWLERLGLSPGALSPLSDEPFEGLAPSYARRWPALARVPWFLAVGDGAASNVGSGCAGPDRAALSIGTSGALRLVTEHPPDRLPPSLWQYRVDRRRVLVGGALNEGGGLVAWVRQVLALEDIADAERRVTAAVPDGHGLTVLPFIAGERSPGWNPEMRFTLAGASLHTSAVDILQAVMESIAYRFALIDRDLRPLAPDRRLLVASGGGAVNAPAWLAMIASALATSVVLTDEPEATSRGAAVLALERLCPASPLPEPAFGQPFEPDAARHAVYNHAVERQQSLYAALAGWHSARE